MAENGVEDIDTGYAAFVKNMGDMKEIGVLVGIRQEDGGATPYDESEMTIAAVATVNEFGSDDGHVPERSFLRSTVDEKESEYGNDITDGAGKAVDGTRTLKSSMTLLGAKVARDVQKKIVSLDDPPNAPYTIDKKGSSNPLIDTGRMKETIGYELDEGRK